MSDDPRDVDSRALEDVTPLNVEAWLRWCLTALTLAQRELRSARDEEVNKEHEYRKAKRAAMFHPDCPQVTRGGVTTAERDAWVEQQSQDKELTYRLAAAKKDAAADHLRTLRDQASIVQSLGASVRQAYSAAGAA